MAGPKRAHIKLTERDARILSALEVMRVVDREQAMRLAPFTSIPRANARLLALVRAGQLSRLSSPDQVVGRKHFYFLPGHVWPRTALPHQLALNEVFLQVRSPPPSITFRTWRRISSPLSPLSPLIPDGYFMLDTSEGMLASFVELDLGTETGRVWEEKVERYLALALSGEFSRIFSLPRFRVLVVGPTEKRIQSLRSIVVGLTTKLFWFATISSIKRDGLFAPIWLRPEGDERLSLI
jgi:hypothetical protein